MTTTRLRFVPLDPAEVASTVDKLQRRIVARFGPARGLAVLTGQLHGVVEHVADQSSQSHQRVRRVRTAARAVSAVVLVASAAAVALALRDAIRSGPEKSFEWLPLIESTVNDIVFAALAVAFLWVLPERLERRRLLDLVHGLRTMAHIADMHQLTKDPERLLPTYRPTGESASNDLDADGMRHYLDYCSELLALIGKTAALCADQSTDSVVLGAVSDIESLTVEISQKIWQKISLLRS